MRCSSPYFYVHVPSMFNHAEKGKAVFPGCCQHMHDLVQKDARELKAVAPWKISLLIAVEPGAVPAVDQQDRVCRCLLLA